MRSAGKNGFAASKRPRQPVGVRLIDRSEAVLRVQEGTSGATSPTLVPDEELGQGEEPGEPGDAAHSGRDAVSRENRAALVGLHIAGNMHVVSMRCAKSVPLVSHGAASGSLRERKRRPAKSQIFRCLINLDEAEAGIVGKGNRLRHSREVPG